MFRYPERGKVVETDHLAVAPTNADEVKIDFQNGSGTKDTYGPLSGLNTPISVAAPKPPLPNMDSRSVLPTKTPSFASSNIYPLLSLKAPAPFRGGIKFKAATSSLSGEGYSLKLGSFSSGLPVIDSDVSKPIFEIKATEYKNNIPTPMLSGSGKTPYLLVPWLQAPHQKSAVVGLLIIPA